MKVWLLYPPFPPYLQNEKDLKMQQINTRNVTISWNGQCKKIKIKIKNQDYLAR